MRRTVQRLDDAGLRILAPFFCGGKTFLGAGTLLAA